MNKPSNYPNHVFPKTSGKSDPSKKIDKTLKKVDTSKNVVIKCKKGSLKPCDNCL